ncbi:putative portal protein [Psychrobacillus phage PVJ1]|nr:putative portal protein [Psychrobacillus phage PVJ1]
MALVLLDPIVIKSNATATANARRIFSAKTQMVSNATVSVKLLRVQKAGSHFKCNAAVKGRIIKIVKSSGAIKCTAVIPLTHSRLIKYVKSNIKGIASTVSKAHKYKTARADLRAESSFEIYVYDRDIRASMLGYLPPYYKDIKDIQSLIVSEANEFTMLYAKLDELFNQFFIDTATYSLADWENATNVRRRKQTLEDRRMLVKQKFTGLGTVTPVVLKEVVDEFFEVEVNELPEPSVIELKRINRRGRYGNLDEVKETVDEIIPRHLQPRFVFDFLPWRELDMIRRPWSEVSELSFAEISNMKWRDLEGTGIRWKQLEQLTFKQIEESYNLNKIEEAQHEQ